MNLSIPQLQNLIKRDSKSYTNEFLAQYRHFQAKLEIFSLSPAANDTDFAALVTFISHVFNLYPEIESVAAFPQLLMSLLSDFHQQLHPDVRKSMVMSLILIRNKNMLTTEKLLSLFFTLFRCHDKQLRALLHTHIVSDIKNANAKSKNNALNKTLQNFMYTMLKDANDIAAKKSLEVMIDLYRKNIWNDQKTVNVIADACFSKAPKILATALNFFLGHDKEEVDEDEEEGIDMDGLKHTLGINKKKKSRKTQLAKAVASVKRKERGKSRAEVFNFSALHLINDAQGFTEKLFSRLRAAHSNHNIKFELRQLMLNLITRMVGIHKLMLLGLYEYIIPFLKPAQREVTSILACIAQASHDIVPPDVIEPVVTTIANHFIWSNCSGEVICAGLNGLREICMRCPLAMPETLLSSIIDDFKRHHEKGVGMAIRGLITLYRDYNPEMLKKRDRGKAATMAGNKETAKYGEKTVLDTIDGLEFFDENSSEEETAEPGEGWEGWEVEGQESESDGFEDVGDAEVLSDEEEKDVAANAELLEPKEIVPAVATEEERKLTARQLATERILTDEDFARLKKIKAKKEAERMAGMTRSRVSLKDLLEDDDSDDAEKEFVDPLDIQMGTKRKQNYEQRMESIMTGREGRDKFGSKKNSQSRGSTTNKEKSKKKSFVMMKHKVSVSGKAKRSLREQQQILRQHIVKQKKQF